MTTENLVVWGIGTSRTVRVLWMMAELGLPYEHRQIRSRTGETQTDEYNRLNPKQKIPTLVHGDFVLTESVAIMNYLARAFPLPTDFLSPQTAIAAAKLDEWCYFIQSELDEHALYLMRRHGDLPQIYGAAPQAVASAQEYFLKQLNAMLPAIERATPYLLGEPFSIADMLLMTCIDWAILYDIPLPESLLVYRDRIAQRPSYQQAQRANYPEWFEEGASHPLRLKLAGYGR